MKIGLVQINNTFSGANYFPYSVGMLQAYAEKHLSNPADYEFLLPVYRKVSVDEAVRELMQADIAAFSAYVWNMQRSLAIAEELKRRKPGCMIVFGGPHVPDPLEEISHEHGMSRLKKLKMIGEMPRGNRVAEFFAAHPFIDIAVHGEGELAFTSLLENISHGSFDSVPSISYRSAGGMVRRNEKNPRSQELLSKMPSPYLSGVFDRLMERVGTSHEWLGLWETNRGCPFSCGYCDWGGATASKVYTFDLERLYKELEWFALRKVEFIFCCDANFAIFDRDVNIAKRAAAVKKEYQYPKALSVQNAKNSEDRVFWAQKALADAGLNKGVTLAFESLHEPTLEAIRRKNIRLQDFKNLQRRFSEEGIQTYCDFIIAMPLETYDSFASGISKTIELGQHNRIQFGNLSILPNIEMARPEYRQRYGMVTRRVRSVIYHGTIDDATDGIHEIDELVVATDTMPAEDWVRTRVFCWMAGFLHFDKILQIPLILLHERTGISYRDLIEAFTDKDISEYPTLAAINDFFVKKAQAIQQGDIEYCPSREWLGIYWPADEYIFIQLCREEKLAFFYKEAEQILLRILLKRGRVGTGANSVERALLHDAIVLNRALIKMPFQSGNVRVELSRPLWEFYRARLKGKQIGLEERPVTYLIDRTSEQRDSWDVWYREVVWYGNKKGAYLYGNVREQQERAGHY